MKGSVDDLNIEKPKSRVFTIVESEEPKSRGILRSSSSHDNLHLHDEKGRRATYHHAHHHAPAEVPHYLGTLKGRDLKKAKQLSEHTRLVDKHGRNQVSLKDMGSILFMKDYFTSMVDTPWFYVTVAFFVSFIVMWVFFGILYWLVAYQHNDIEFYNNPGNMSDHTVCVDNVYDFTTAFLFSLEGQTTIGYGSRGPTNRCWFVIVVQFIQWLMAYLFDSLVVTIIFTKLARPKYRAKSIEFSKNAVINERDGRLVLIVRIVNMRDSLMLDVTVSGKLLKTRRTPDGEWLALEERNVEFDNSKALFLTQPVDYVHTIDERSPLYELSESVLDNEEEPLELVVIMSGVIEGTGMACQVRTSYIANEILWGHRFKPSTIGSKINICNLTTEFIDFNNEPEKITRNTVLRRFEYDYNMFHVHYAIEPPMSGRSAEDRDFDRASSVSSTTESMDSITRQVGVRANILANMMTNTSI